MPCLGNGPLSLSLVSEWRWEGVRFPGPGLRIRGEGEEGYGEGGEGGEGRDNTVLPGLGGRGCFAVMMSWLGERIQSLARPG